MTWLVASVVAETVSDLKARSQRAWAAGATAVEVRADAFREPPGELAEYLRGEHQRTWIVTRRSAAEGGRSTDTAEQRAAFLADAATRNAVLVDFEFADWKRSPTARARLSAILRASDSPAPRLILSAHHLQDRPDGVASVVAEMLTVPNVAAAKIAYHAGHIADSFDALDLMQRHGPRVIAIALGDDGLWTRILAKKLGAFAAYAALDAESPTAPGQPTLHEMVNRYRWRDLGPDTRLFGLIGDPVAHSISPLLHNRWLGDARIDGVYLPLLVRRKGDCVRRFLDQCRHRRWLDLRGLSVTIPHKASVLHWAGNDAEWLARRLGAVNTLVFSGSSRCAYNTDCYAAVDSLCAALGRTRPQLHGLTADVLGSGGAARALVYALPMFGCRVTAFGRSFDRTRRMAAGLQAQAAPWDDRAAGRGEVLINATRVGMWPDVDESPMPPDGVRHRRLVFDVIYNPPQTKLLREAAAAGVATLNGLDMFIRQAAMQFELWTRCRPDSESARALVQHAAAAEPPAPSPANGAMSRTAATRSDRNAVALIGLRGSGKTTVGRELAAMLQVPFFDTDELITVEAGKSISEIFETEGETGFRARERRAVARAVETAPSVISVGGGAILDATNVTALRRSATIIWLAAPPEILYERIAADAASAASRPALTTLEGPDELERLLQERRPQYESAADVTIHTTGRTPTDLARQIVTEVQVQGARRGAGRQRP
jgi:3-dehydroquinate dehydratase/shikimate dehydrogenase